MSNPRVYLERARLAAHGHLVLRSVPWLAVAVVGCAKSPDLAPGTEAATPPSAPQSQAAAPPSEPADLIVWGGSLWTLDPKAPRAEAIAIRHGRVQAVGSTERVAALRGPATRVYELGGGMALPGLTDAHCHVASLGRTLEQVDLRGATSIEDVVSRLQRHPNPGAWIEGRGWDQNLWTDTAMPTHDALTKAFPDRPVWLRRIDGHAGWGNAALLKAAGIDKKTRSPRGGEILRDAKGNPTGVLIDAAMTLVPVPQPTEADVTRYILRAQDHLFARGITAVHDMGVTELEDAVYRRLAASEGRDRLRLRVHGYASQGYFTSHLLGQRKPDPITDEARYLLAGVKVYADGALGSRGAYMFQAYSDRPGHRGLLQATPQELIDLSTRAMGDHWQVATHAIGDAGNRAVLEAYESAIRRHGPSQHRFRVEHVQIIDVSDIPRFAAGGIVPSMQPTHATSDMAWVPARVGSERLAGAYAWKRFRNIGVRLALGSDFPIELADVTHGLHAAITRQDAHGLPEGGWLPDQRLSLEEAIEGFTSHAAYAAHRDGHLGVLREGYQADLTFFAEDLFRLAPQALREAKVRATVVAGEVVYEAATRSPS